MGHGYLAVVGFGILLSFKDIDKYYRKKNNLIIESESEPESNSESEIESETEFEIESKIESVPHEKSDYSQLIKNLLYRIENNIPDPPNISNPSPNPSEKIKKKEKAKEKTKPCNKLNIEDVEDLLEPFYKKYKNFCFYYEGQYLYPEEVFITLYKKSICTDVRGSRGNLYNINIEKLKPSNEELKMFENIQNEMIGKISSDVCFSLFTFEGH